MRKILRNAALTLLLLLLALAGGGAWVLFTPSGFQALLRTASLFFPGQIEAGSVTGRLADDLRLKEVAAQWPGGTIRIADLRLLWTPGDLFQGRLAVEDLALSDIDLRLRDTPEEPEPPPELAFPEVPPLLQRVQASIERLRLRDLRIVPAEGEPTTVERADAKLQWTNGVLILEDFAVHADAGTFEAQGRADFVAPALSLQFKGRTAEPVGELDRFRIDLDLKPRPGPRRLAGPLRLRGAEGKNERLGIDADIDWSRERLALERLRLFRPGEKGELTGHASVRGAEGWPFDFALRLSNLDLAPETGTSTNLSGTLDASGTTEGYRGSFSLTNTVPGWQGGSLAASFSGTGEEIALSDLKGNWLQGEIRGNLSADWTAGWAFRGELSGRALDPAVVTPDWPGRINFDLNAAARGGGVEPLSADIRGKFRDSMLRGRPLAGEIEASLAEDDLRIARFLLRGEGFDLSAQGRLRERIDFRADIPRLGGVVPGARGTVNAQGWVRWRDEHLGGAVKARGERVAMEGVRVARFAIDADYPRKGGPFSISAEIEGAAANALEVEKGVLQGRGTLEDHSLRATVAGDDVRLRFSADGGYADGTWAGTVRELETGGRLPGRWVLSAPAPLQLSREHLRAPSLRLNGLGEETLRASADLAFSPIVGTVQGEWRALDLSRGNPWLDGIVLAGRSSGSMHGRWFADGRLDLKGTTHLAGSALREGRRFTVNAASIDLSWGPSGLRGEWGADFGELGDLQGKVASPQPAGRGWIPETGEGEMQWNLPDLAPLSPFIPEVNITGRSRGEISGRWHDREPIALLGEGEMVGTIEHHAVTLRVNEAQGEIEWDGEGLAAAWSVDLGEAGRTSGRLLSDEPIRRELPRQGEAEVHWRQLDLSLVEPWLPEMELSGRTSGDVVAKAAKDGSLDIDGRIVADARLRREESVVEIPRGEADLRWNAEGLRARWEVALAPQGRITGEASSPTPARLEIPERGAILTRWEGIDMARFRPWLPPGLLLEGMLEGEIEGELLPGERFQMTGNVAVGGGELQWEGEDGVVTASLRRADLNVDWRGDRLQGNAVVALQDYGKAEGEFQIPLPARFPPALEPQGPLRGKVTASLQEKGLLNALFPGLVQESRGHLALDLRAGGRWESPDLAGTVTLADAGAYLPAAGIRMHDARLLAEFSGEEIRITEMRLRSGPGHLEGTGTVRLENWRPANYRLQIRGKGFEAVRLPELRLHVSPDLVVQGAEKHLQVRGEIRIPDMLISGRDTPNPVEPSPDVIIVDAPEEAGRETPLDLDVQVRVVLGEHVLVKAEGVDARLEGAVLVTMTGLETDQITGKGEIRVAQGRYSAYGITLDITRGIILFAGGPVDTPTLDILALRRATAAPLAETRGEEITGAVPADGRLTETGMRTVRAGVRITGTPRTPEVKLYSEPSMPDTEILSYMVLGRPLGQGGGNAGLLMLAANQLLSRGESAVLQDRLKRTFGIDVLEVDAGAGDATGARVTIGKYLNPDLYISFGQSLFTNTQEVRLRYNLSRRLQLESSVGDESAVDLFYQIEFR